ALSSSRVAKSAQFLGPAAAKLAPARSPNARAPPSKNLRWVRATSLRLSHAASTTTSGPQKKSSGKTLRHPAAASATPAQNGSFFRNRQSERTPRNSQSWRRNAPPVQKNSDAACVPQKTTANAATRPPKAQPRRSTMPPIKATSSDASRNSDAAPSGASSVRGPATRLNAGGAL